VYVGGGDDGGGYCSLYSL